MAACGCSAVISSWVYAWWCSVVEAVGPGLQIVVGSGGLALRRGPVADGAVDTLFVRYQSCPSFGRGHEPIQESSAALVCVCVAFLGVAKHFVVSALGAILREHVFLEIRVGDPECSRHRPFPSGSVGFSPGRRFSCLQLWFGPFSQQPWRGLELQNPFRHPSVLDRFTV